MASFHASSRPLDFERGCVIDFDLQTGLSRTVATSKRYLSQMRGRYQDKEAFDRELQKGDPVVYEFHELPIKEDPGDFAFGCSILNPGKVGDEYYFRGTGWREKNPRQGLLQIGELPHSATLT